MKKVLVSLLEGVIVGAVLGIVIALLGIDITGSQIAILIVAALGSTSIASLIGQMINTGKAPVFYEWVYNHGGNRIAVSMGLLTEKLYINDELIDECKQIKLNKAELKGKLKSGEEVRAMIKGGVTTICELYVGNELLRPVATKTP